MLTTTSHDPIALDAQHVLQVYRRAPVVFDHGQGSALFTRAGERYLDLISGVGVASLGHAHPVLSRAIAEQASTLLHTSNLFHHPLQAELATRLSALSGCRGLLLATAARKRSKRASSSRAASGTRRARRAPASSPSITRSTAAPWGRSR